MKSILLSILMLTAFPLFSKNSVLNGKGMRLATIFKIKVYEAELYIPNKSQSPDEIIKQNGRKSLTMTFKRDVSKKKIINGFKDGLKKNSLKDVFSPIYENLSDIKKGDQLSFVFQDDAIVFTHNAKDSIKVKVENASQYLLLWIGKVPNKELRKGLLGIK